MEARAPPPSVRAKPRVAPKPRMYPTATVLYEYTAQDNDEISLAVGDLVEVSHLTAERHQTKPNPATNLKKINGGITFSPKYNK